MKDIKYQQCSQLAYSNPLLEARDQIPDWLLASAGFLEMKVWLDSEEMLEALLSHLDVCTKTDCFGWQGLADEIEHAQSSSLTAQVWLFFR